MTADMHARLLPLDAGDDASPPAPMQELMRHARDASEFLKALSHENRLLLLCILSQGERSVGDLEAMLGLRQAAVSQQLARLRLDGLVQARREGKQVFYSLGSDRVRRVIDVIHDIYCGTAPGAPSAT